MFKIWYLIAILWVFNKGIASEEEIYPHTSNSIPQNSLDIKKVQRQSLNHYPRSYCLTEIENIIKAITNITGILFKDILMSVHLQKEPTGLRDLSKINSSIILSEKNKKNIADLEESEDYKTLMSKIKTLNKNVKGVSFYFAPYANPSRPLK